VIELAAYHRREKTLRELAQGLGPEHLIGATREMCDRELALVAAATDRDVTFVPDDPAAHDKYAQTGEEAAEPWTLGHVIVHATASSEEAAAHALTLARGLAVDGRSRYEIPWREVNTIEFVRRRIEESRRMRIAMVQAWPDQPHLDITCQPYPSRPAMNAVERFLFGLAHEDSHLDQISKIVRQAQKSQ
jgi:hypothetical protein